MMRLLLIFSLVGLLTGCDKKSDSTTSSAQAKVAKDAPSLHSKTSEAAATPRAPSNVETPSSEKPIVGEPRDTNRPYDRATLEKAYVEITCALPKSDPAALEAIFFKYGFHHPKAWTRAWAKANKDEAWVAKLDLLAKQACPAKKPVTDGE